MLEKVLEYVIGRLQWWLSEIQKRREESLLGAARSPMWGVIRRAFAEYVPAIDPLTGSKDVELHHAEEAFQENPARELDPTNFVWGQRTPTHQWIYHLGNFRSLNKKVFEWIEIIRNRPMWEGGQWVNKPINNIKYRMTQEDLDAWNKRFGTNWKFRD